MNPIDVLLQPGSTEKRYAKHKGWKCISFIKATAIYCPKHKQRTFTHNNFIHIYLSKESWHHLTWPLILLVIHFFFAWVLRNRKEVYLGDDNSLTLTFNARNEGEGGAYEAELYVVLPPEADYSGIARNNEVTRNAKPSENPQLPATDIPLGTWLQMLVFFLMIVLCCGLTNLSSCFSEPDPADLQLWDREPDPIPQLWFGQPDEVWYQRKDTAVFWQFFSI